MLLCLPLAIWLSLVLSGLPSCLWWELVLPVILCSWGVDTDTGVCGVCVCYLDSAMGEHEGALAERGICFPVLQGTGRLGLQVGLRPLL